MGRRKRRHAPEFAELYDELRTELGCPVRVLFVIATDSEMEVKHRIAAAAKLIRQRYATHKAIEMHHTGDDPLTTLLGELAKRRIEHTGAAGMLDEYVEAEYEEVPGAD